jgi:putative oxidoreductase
MRLARLIIRVVLGALFIGHGTQKLFGWFGGHGPEGTGGFFEGLGLRPGKQHAIAAGLTEAGGGAMLALGLLTPIGAALITSTMATAIRTAHRGKGPWATDGGWEYPLIIIATVMGVAEAGPGSLSLDSALGLEMSGTSWALAQLAVGVGGSFLVTSMSGAAEGGDAAPEGAAA